MQVQQIMRRDFVCAEPEESLEAACQTMRLARLRHLLVTRGDALVGILSYRDLLERPKGFDWVGARIGDAMRPEPLCVVALDTPLGEAADRMCRYGYGCLPVVNGGQLVGLVTETDLLRAAYGLRPS
jgi:CBS domain-containing protein